MPEFDHTDNGEYCFVTGSENFNDDRYNDVDNGETILYSPIYNLSSYSKALISYWKYYTNNLGDNPDSDFWRVQIEVSKSCVLATKENPDTDTLWLIRGIARWIETVIETVPDEVDDAVECAAGEIEGIGFCSVA